LRDADEIPTDHLRPWRSWGAIAVEVGVKPSSSEPRCAACSFGNSSAPSAYLSRTKMILLSITGYSTILYSCVFFTYLNHSCYSLYLNYVICLALNNLVCKLQLYYLFLLVNFISRFSCISL
jgi:hypothetical protein